MILLKSNQELEMMRQAGKILARIMAKVEDFVRIGILTQDINDFAEELMHKEKVAPAFKGHRGFPASVCTSVNEEIVHGIPGKRKLNEGDIVSIDIGINYQGFFSDAAVTLPLGMVDAQHRRLIDVTMQGLAEGIKQAEVNNHLSDISSAIQNYVEGNGFSVVRHFVGHGIGKSLHEDPEVPNFGSPHCGAVLKNGMVLAIEPMVNMGTWESEILENGWTAVTKDGLSSAHFEHTVAITTSGSQILTN